MKILNASLLALALMGCSLLKREQPSFLLEAQKGLGYAVQIAESNAEYELLKLARTSPVEADWLYANGRLVDVGVEELADQTFTATDQILKESKNCKELVLYHVHQRKNGNPISPPSGRDIQLYVRLKREIERHGASLEEKVIDSKGVWTISVDKRMSNAIYSAHLKNDTEFQGRFNSIMANLAQATIFSWHHITEDEALGAFVDGAARRGIILQYERFE